MSRSDVQLIDPNSELALLPLKDIVVFPHMIVPVFISEELCLNAVEFAVENGRKIFLSAFTVPGEDGLGLSTTLEPPFDVYDVGTVCSIMRTRKLPDGRMKVLVQGLHKAKISALASSDPFPRVRLSTISDPTVSSPSAEVEALVRSVKENLEKVVSLGKVLSPDILMILEDVANPGRLADLIAANLGLKVHEAQGILGLHAPVERLNRVHSYLSREIEVYQMQVRIQSQAKEEINRSQREHYLREQMRAIRSELGDADGKDEFENLWRTVAQAKLTEEAREEVNRQLRRLERMHQDTSEATLTRTHIETILALPWERYSEDNLDLRAVKKTLDEDHYSLDQVKDRIIEYLAVKKLNPDAKSPILCFVGPPGVGKTSLGKSIARSMGRKFARISLGGVRDEADIRGHRKTYVGAYPGRVIQAIKSSATSNPVIMLDEVEKMGADHRGDPAAALLEVLDPEQNKSFVDHYIGVAFDLSRVMFIANANSLDTIPAPLRDRLEIIEVSGYTEDEKCAIANQYIIPKQLQENGLRSDKVSVSFSKPAVSMIINAYTRESGLRNLERNIASVCRKIARQYAENDGLVEDARTLRVTPSLVERHLGVKRFEQDYNHTLARIGVALGMAYTPYGGEILAIETNLIPSARPRLVLTGQLGSVMKESAQAAFSYLRSRAHLFGIDVSFLERFDVHVHVPAGGIPKDGPSAGCTIVSSILSALTSRKPAARTAMTGEITLHGCILPIGGLKEKLLAAQREDIDTVIIPLKNKATFEALPISVRKNLKVSFVSDYIELYRLVFDEGAEKSVIHGKLPERKVPQRRDRGVDKIAS